MGLMLDPACEYETFGDAVKVGKACDEQDFFWYEDSYRDGGNLTAHRPKTTGVNQYAVALDRTHPRTGTVYRFHRNEATDFIRADPEYDGGITGAIKRARIAEGFGLDVEIHAPGPAHRHCIAAMRNANYYEVALVHPDCQNTQPPIYRCGYSDMVDTINDEGYVEVPDGLGPGVEYDWEYIEEMQAGSVRVYE
ncbi:MULTISPECIES: enolase C-terminal domain-like protein [Natrialbaceae]|uniref:enolase C-terminal domain-like protein n=1 Tax=Natrialbaceae TaxID=1644061 RepID=UPI00207D1AFE|nr:enolase C-terminal domain-like protein [Natronococcus sp. CG52]